MISSSGLRSRLALLAVMRERLWPILQQGLREHYMLGFSVLALGVAAAAAAGAFEAEVEPLTGRPSAVAQPRAVAYPDPPPLVVTYFLVDSPEDVDAVNAAESQMVQREWLSKAAIEVLLARTPEEEEEAMRLVEEARRRAPAARVVVEDLRQQ